MTSILQPMDQGVIKTLKQHYRKRILKHTLTAMENGKPCTITLLDAVREIAKTWDVDITSKTIENCFKKAGFANTVGDSSWTEEDDLSLAEIKLLFEEYRNKQPNLQDIVLEEYLTVDSDILVAAHPTDEEILSSLNSKTSDEEIADSDDEGSDEHTDAAPIPSYRETCDSFQTIFNFLCASENVPDIFYASLHAVDQFCEIGQLKKQKQSKITDFIKKC